MRTSWPSKSLLPQISSPRSHLDDSVHYAYGKIELAQKRWAAAKHAFDASLRIGLASAPIHPITTAAYYSLGCVEYERSNLDNAKYVDWPL